MTITCNQCGADRWTAPDIQPHPQGGYDVVLVCADCHVPQTLIHEEDPELAGALAKFFGKKAS